MSRKCLLCSEILFSPESDKDSLHIRDTHSVRYNLTSDYFEYVVNNITITFIFGYENTVRQYRLNGRSWTHVNHDISQKDWKVDDFINLLKNFIIIG